MALARIIHEGRRVNKNVRRGVEFVVCERLMAGTDRRTGRVEAVWCEMAARRFTGDTPRRRTPQPPIIFRKTAPSVSQPWRRARAPDGPSLV
jgi:hypothetical protein